MGQDIGRTHHELFHHPHPHPYPHPPPYLHHRDMRYAIQIEIEKERKRGETIMYEISRRRFLEAEVRRELMLERELAQRRGVDGFPYGSSPQIEFDPPIRFPLLGTRVEERSQEKKIYTSLDQTKRLNGGFESRGLDTLPFQRTTDLRISEVKPVPEANKEKPRVIFLDKPGANISGLKRKAVPQPDQADAIEFPSNVVLKKKAKQEWNCALCQVGANSARSLNQHLQGNKHKSNEAALRSHKGPESYKIQLNANKMEFKTESLLVKKTGEDNQTISDKLKENQLVSIQEMQKNGDPQNPANLGKNGLESIQEMGKNGELKNEKYKFWCEKCKVGTSTRKAMNAHEMGKKHVNRARRSDQNSGACLKIDIASKKETKI